MPGVNYQPGRVIDANGDTQFNAGQIQPLDVQQVYFDYDATQIHVGSVVEYQVAADPRDGFVAGPGWDVVVMTGTTGVIKSRIAGVVVDLGPGGGKADGWITIAKLVPGYVYTFAVAVNLGEGDGLKFANSGAYADDSGAYAVTDFAIALYDENDANNPHGVDAISAAIGLVEAVYTGYDLQNTA